MYLSRVAIDQSNRQKIKDLSHLGAYHNWVEQSFPTELQQGERLRHLWRLDTLNGQQYLLVLSQNQPDLTQLERYGIPGSAQVKNYAPLLNQLANGQQWRFRLTANPTHSVAEPGKRGQVYAHVTVAQQTQWLLDRATKHGFEVLASTDANPRYAVNVTERDTAVLHHRHGRTVKLSRVSFEGVLTITDVASFKALLTAGIGRERAYGMGLMTIIPVS